MKTNLTKAHDQLFSRRPDECFPSLNALWEHCEEMKQQSVSQWRGPAEIEFEPGVAELIVRTNSDTYTPTDWSFSQLCSLSRVHKDTVNRLSCETAARVLTETATRRGRPLQLYTLGQSMRSVNGAGYTRLFNADVLSLALEFVTDFEAPQEAMNGGTGLYCGEQDMFCFLIDPAGWVEINDEAFAPGFFLWNSEVGRRSVGVQTFWFQAVCRNHIVWDAVEIVEFARKHTGNVHEALDNIRNILLALNEKRDERRDGFAAVLKRAMTERLGEDQEEVMQLLHKQGISRTLSKEALQIAEEQGGFTIFAVVDALTRLSQRIEYAGDQVQADAKASQLLALAT